jgi:Predicted acyl-CoA transferases/carnitine dehydratase
VFHHWNRNKYGITLNLKDNVGVDIAKRLVKISDVALDSFPPRVMKNFGLDYPALKEVKPDIIMLSMPAYGASGPEKDYRAFGASMEQMSGHAELSGYIGEYETPMKSGIDYGDPTAGVTAAGLILAALHYRRRTAKGQWIDVSQCEPTSLLIGEALMDYTMNHRMWKRMGNRDPWMVPQGCYRCQGDDKWVVISVSSEEEWRALINVLGNPPWAEEERFRDRLSRWHNQDELDKLINEWTSQYEHYEAMELLQKAGVPAGAVLNAAEVAENEHLKQRGYFLSGSHPKIGTAMFQGSPMKLSKSPITIRRLAPALGEHNEYILKELLGMSEDEIAELEKKQVIGKTALPGASRV